MNLKIKFINEKKVISFLFVVGVVFVFFSSKGWAYVDKYINAAINGVKEKSNSYTSNIDSQLIDAISCKQEMIDINGSIAKKLNMRDFFIDNGGVVLKNGYVSGVYSYTTTDYEVQQMQALKNYLDNLDIKLLYVNEPVKYLDDKEMETDLGLKSYANQNIDRLLSRLDDIGVNYLDLRQNIIEENKNSYEMFYRTDHHWTVQSGKWAAEKIVDKLNSDYGYSINKELYLDENFTYTEYKNAWLGEQGKKLGKSYVGLDDFTLIEPKYDTNFIVYINGGCVQGSFADTMINKSAYSDENNEDVYKAGSWHYSYLPGMNGSMIGNWNVGTGKILLLSDSYAQVMAPFLALGVNEVDTLVLRDWGEEFDLGEYLSAGNYDTVIVSYAEFMVGAHDYPGTANYSMFDFFK